MQFCSTGSTPNLAHLQIVIACTGAVVVVVGARVQSCLLEPSRCWTRSGLQLDLSAADGMVHPISAIEGVCTGPRVQVHGQRLYPCTLCRHMKRKDMSTSLGVILGASVPRSSSNQVRDLQRSCMQIGENDGAMQRLVARCCQ